MEVGQGCHRAAEPRSYGTMTEGDVMMERNDAITYNHRA